MGGNDTLLWQNIVTINLHDYIQHGLENSGLRLYLILVSLLICEAGINMLKFRSNRQL